MSTDNQRTRSPPPLTTTTTTITETESDPEAKASYEQVVSDERLFMETLRDLHRSLGTRFIIPTIGGNPLDLHRLFVEVTCRGGLQKVIGDRKWKDVTTAFTFPATMTSASFLLRKYYISLLQTYEQVYFFQKRDFKLSSNEHPPLRVGSLLKGKINGKFESAYTVTATFGSEILNGVLYHVPLHPHEPHNSPPLSQRLGRKRSRSETDTSGLKSIMGGYNVFFAEHYSNLRPLYSGKEKVIVKHINSLWNSLTESEKEEYQERDKQRQKISTSKYERS